MTQRDNPVFPYALGVDIKGIESQTYAAIHLGVPNTGTGWLDRMILDARRHDLAKTAMGAIIGSRNWDHVPEEELIGVWTKLAYMTADAMITEGAK